MLHSLYHTRNTIYKTAFLTKAKPYEVPLRVYYYFVRNSVIVDDIIHQIVLLLFYIVYYLPVTVLELRFWVLDCDSSLITIKSGNKVAQKIVYNLINENILSLKVSLLRQSVWYLGITN